MFNFIKRKIKWILISVGILGIALASTLIPVEQTEPVGAVLTIEEETLSLKTIIETDLQPNGKYKRRDKEIIDGVGYRVDEYDASGNLGYVITITKEVNGIIYQKREVTGIEAWAREYDWIEIGTTIAIATTTIK